MRLQLHYDSTDALLLRKVRDYYEALANALRAVPGLQLVDEQAVGQAETLADFRVTISNPAAADAQQLPHSPEWAATTRVEVLNNGSGGTSDPAGTVYILGMVGDAWRGANPAGILTRGPLYGDCTLPKTMTCSLADLAERQVMALRKKVFPRDKSLERGLEARIFDAALPKRERDMAISDVLSMKMALSDATVREILTRMAHTQDVSERGNLQAMLAGQQRPEIVQPLIDMARYDSDASIRIEAVRMLAADYPKDPVARAALEEIAADVSNPKLQTTAEGALSRLREN